MIDTLVAIGQHQRAFADKGPDCILMVVWHIQSDWYEYISKCGFKACLADRTHANQCHWLLCARFSGIYIYEYLSDTAACNLEGPYTDPFHAQSRILYPKQRGISSAAQRFPLRVPFMCAQDHKLRVFSRSSNPERVAALREGFHAWIKIRFGGVVRSATPRKSSKSQVEERSNDRKRKLFGGDSQGWSWCWRRVHGAWHVNRTLDVLSGRI